MDQNRIEETQVHEDKKTYSLWDFVIGIVLGLISIFVIINSVMMPTFGEALYSRPGLVPLITSISLLGLSIMLVFKALKENRISLLPREIESLIKSKEAHRFVIISLATLVYILLLDITTVHFIILTTLFLWFLFIYFKVKIVVSTVLAIVTASVIYGFFTQVFTIPMP
ncbi:MAG: tripartite tricarboxylate transporter TctB family protein [Deltaproteobacteria bacterium]|nr:tripartite tricarboxylate transporter TctB family protein [Deltaproteobacteria bacterium]